MVVNEKYGMSIMIFVYFAYLENIKNENYINSKKSQLMFEGVDDADPKGKSSIGKVKRIDW